MGKTPTIDEICEAYLADRENPHAEKKCKWPDSLRGHLKALRTEYGAERVRRFAEDSRNRMRATCDRWREQGYAAFTIRKRVSILKAAFRFAVDEGLIKRKDEPVIKLPPNGVPRERYLDPETELKRLLEAADDTKTPDHILLFIEIALLTGARRGAILDLQWSHVDFDKRVIRFRDTEAAEDRSKKRRGNKPMTDRLYASLLRAYQARDEDCSHVIAWRGKRVKSVYVGVKALYKRAGLTNVWTHDLRRSSATYVHTETNGDMTAAANHIVDTEATARKHYVQEDPRVHLPAMNAVDAVMARARGEVEESASAAA